MADDRKLRVIEKLKTIPLAEKIKLTPRSSAELLELLIDENHPSILKAALSNPQITDSHVLQILQQSAISPEIISILGQNRNLYSGLRIKREIIKHPKTSLELAAAIMQEMALMDLLPLTRGTRLQTGLKQHLFNIIQQRLNQLSEEELILLLGKVSPDLASSIIRRGGEKLLSYAIEHHHLREADAVRLANSSESSPKVLTLLFETPPWGKKFDVRWGLLNNTNTPLDIRIKIYKTLTNADKQNFRRHKRLPGIAD